MKSPPIFSKRSTKTYQVLFPAITLARFLSFYVIAVGTFMVVSPVHSQIRGVYPLGMSAVNSGVTPQSGFTYSNLFMFYSRDTLRGLNGEVLATGENSLMMDMNAFVWVSARKILGAKFSLSATLPIANNSLSSDVAGAFTGGGGFADSYYQPLILGWQANRVDIRAIYGFLAPTGRFTAGAANNVGSGYWTHVLASGQTIYLTSDKKTAVSAFEMYEFHTVQEGTGIHPGQNLDLDYSVTRVFPFSKALQLQLGLIGYGQWQTTDKTGPEITPAQATAHYKVNSLGFATYLMLPTRKMTVGFKYFKEFSNRATFQGYSAQIVSSVNF